VAPMKEVDVQIFGARGHADYQACVDLQREVWGFSEIQDIAALPLLLIGNEYGGRVLVAEASEGRVIGFAFAMLGMKPCGGLIWWSHMTGVAREFQGQGTGIRLKLAQREDALKQGISEIWWTFDPLQAMNAHFNVRKLGAVVSEYEENVYGHSSSPLHHGLPTDRLVAVWALESERVVDRVSGEAPVILRDFDRLPSIIEVHDQRPGSPDLGFIQTPLLLEIPVRFAEILQADRDLALDWQRKVRSAFLHYFERGYHVTDFMIVDTPEPQALYVLEKPDS
jgi:predicted GNAT superfamily acetyltransferase